MDKKLFLWGFIKWYGIMKQTKNIKWSEYKN
jgi:hypothetical protein